jgi:hypothetical protein
MDDMEVQPAGASAPGLTQWQRVACAFTAPPKTFEDIRRGNRSWWLPLILITLTTYLLFAAVTQRIGMQQVVENQIQLNPKSATQMAQATPEQREKGMKFAVGLTEAVFIANPAFTIGGIALLSLGLLGTINFVFAGRAKYGSILAVWFYASLPEIVKTLLGIMVIYGGITPESFNIKNFAPTNVGAFLDPAATGKALYTLATSVDAITIWTLVLLGMGTAAVAGVKRRSGYLAVFGWWAIFVLFRVGWAAFS